MLKTFVDITKKLNNYRCENNHIQGDLSGLDNNDIDNITAIQDYVGELECGSNIIAKDDLHDYIGRTINITIETGNIRGYYRNCSSFLNKNKIALTVNKFYIKDIDFFYDKENQNGNIDNQLISNYFKNLNLIDILKKISDYQNKLGSELELFFYKTEKGLRLNIDYSCDDLQELNIRDLNKLEDHFFHQPNKEERRQIFINDLIGLLKDNNSYNELLEKWNVLIENYNQSFKFYLSGFSFEKIKTASTGYFQEFTDRVYNQISKATTNIFIVPAAYIFFIKALSVSENIFQNTLLLVTSFIFSYIMHKVIFQNMTEGMSAIQNDIQSFKDKVQANLPQENQKQLNKLLEKDIPKQCHKIKILKISNWILFTLGFVFFIYTIISQYCFFDFL